MIFKLILLFGFSFQQVFSYFSPKDEAESKPSDFAMRFANIDSLQKDNTLVQIFLYQRKGDPGTLIPQFNYEYLIDAVDKSRKTAVFFNGHPSAESEEPFLHLRESLFDIEQLNVLYINIDWTKHQITFLDALTLGESLGQFIGDLLKDFHFPNNNYHFFGHCAGAEIATTVAKNLLMYAGIKIARLTAFDPYITNSTKLYNSLEFFEFVDVYHSGIYDPAFFPVGTIDFYPNAGVKQPGCTGGDALDNLICHHQRSIFLYIESIYTSVRAIEGFYSPFEKHLRVMDNPSMVTFGHNVEYDHSGSFYLPTYRSQPFLMDYF